MVWWPRAPSGSGREVSAVCTSEPEASDCAASALAFSSDSSQARRAAAAAGRSTPATSSARSGGGGDGGGDASAEPPNTEALSEAEVALEEQRGTAIGRLCIGSFATALRGLLPDVLAGLGEYLRQSKAADRRKLLTELGTPPEIAHRIVRLFELNGGIGIGSLPVGPGTDRR